MKHAGTQPPAQYHRRPHLAPYADVRVAPGSLSHPKTAIRVRTRWLAGELSEKLDAVLPDPREQARSRASERETKDESDDERGGPESDPAPRNGHETHSPGTDGRRTALRAPGDALVETLCASETKWTCHITPPPSWRTTQRRDRERARPVSGSRVAGRRREGVR